MKSEHKELLRNKFLGIVAYSMADTGNFSIDRFAESATSLLNVWVNAGIIHQKDKLESMRFLCEEFNLGLNNALSPDLLDEWAIELSEDKSINFALLRE